jgi:hypothetical protein
MSEEFEGTQSPTSIELSEVEDTEGGSPGLDQQD